MKGFATENLRRISLISCFVSLILSLGLFLIARQRAPASIIILFIGWLSAPPVAFLLGHYLSKGWAERTRRLLYLVNTLATPIALSTYLYQTIWPRQITPAFYWVAVPPTVVLIGLVVVGMAAVSGKNNQTLI